MEGFEQMVQPRPICRFDEAGVTILPSSRADAPGARASQIRDGRVA